MSSIVKCKFCKPEVDNFNILRSYLPQDYQYMVCNFSIQNGSFKTRLRTSGKDQDTAQRWLEEFHMFSKCTMRVERTYPRSGTKNVFKVDLRCQHNTRPRNEKVREKESCKNTDCPAKMGITIKRVVTERKSRSKDPHLPDCPTVIQMDFCHNHAILAPEILKHRSVLPEVKEKILALFKLGHNPATALDMHKYDLLLEHGENFEKVCHDRAILPDPQFCYRLYYKIVRKQSCPSSDDIQDTNESSSSSDKKSFLDVPNCDNSIDLNSSQNNTFQDSMAGDSTTAEKKVKKKRKLESTVVNKNEMASQLEDILCKFCESGGFAGMQVIGEDTVMALCSPLMHRVHTLIRQSGELVFIDTYGDLEEANSCRIFLFVTYSSIGAVPLGCLVTTSATATCIKSALELWKQILPEGCFYNKSDGPYIFFTNDNEVERQSLKSSFPNSHLLTCLSHILQSSWIFIWDRKNAIRKEHRSLLFYKLKTLLFSQTIEELEMNYSYALQDILVRTYTVFMDYLKHIYTHRHDWSLVYRRHLLPRNDDSILWEASMIILKDPILSRSRTYNQLQIVDILSRLDTYYERKLIDLANSRFDCVRFSRFLFIDLPREAYTITQKSESEYEVHNDAKDTMYQVDVTLGMCECRFGKSGSPCKHQLLVFRNFTVPIYDFFPANTQAEKKLLLHLATGQEVENEPPAQVPNNVQNILHEPCPTDINIHDLDPCSDSGFFLDENAACEGLNQHPTLNPGLMQPEPPPMLREEPVLNQHTAINNHIVEQHPAMLDPNPPLNHVNLNHHLTNLNQNASPMPPPPPPCPPMQEQSPHVKTVMDLLDQVYTKLKERTTRSPELFIPALGTFVKNIDSLSSDSSLEYALYSFGKFSKSVNPLFKRKIVDNKLVDLQSAGVMKKKKLPLKSSKMPKNDAKPL